MKNFLVSRGFTIFSLLLIINSVNCGRILVLAPAPSFSHQIVFRGLVRALLNHGHEVVFVTPLLLNDSSLTNYTEIAIRNAYDLLIAVDFTTFMPNYNNYTKSEIDELGNFMGSMEMKYMYSLPEIKKMSAANSKEKFDVVIVEAVLGLGFYAIAHMLNATLIGAMSTELSMYHNHFYGAPLLPSHLSNWELFYRIGPEMTFWDRVQNYVVAMYSLYGWYDYQISKNEKFVKELTGRDIPPLNEIAKEMSILLVNHDTITGYARPLPPNVVLFSGLHIEKEPPPLSTEVNEFLGNATEGFVYMSLGCNMKSAILPPKVVNAIYNVFSKLTYKVLWKYEADNIPRINGNIFTNDWFPQQSVLAHPNIKLFIFQGGIQSTEETIYYGVPIIGVPIMFDQTYRIRKLVSLGVGRMLDSKTIDEETFEEAISDVIYNKSYKTNMMKLSNLTKDKPYDSKEHVVWWVEYVMRHKGAPHLRYSGINDPWYQQFDIDIVAFLAIISFIATVLCLTILARILRWLYKYRRVLTLKNSLMNAAKKEN